MYGVEAKEALRARATDFLARLGALPTAYITGPIDLNANDSSSLGAYYEQGSICAIYYEKGDLPLDEVLETDLQDLVNLYFVLATKDLFTDTESEEDDEEDLYQEDLRKLREHKRIERNRKLASRAKKVHGYICQACKFDFEEQYGEIGKGYIEAHHLTPLYKLTGQKVTLNPTTDFAVLCSNCHCMIHKSQYVSQVGEFRAKYVTGRDSQSKESGSV